MLHFFNQLFSRQFLFFFFFGGLAALVNLAVGKILYDMIFPGRYYTISVFLAALSGLLVNFFCNYMFNFTVHPRRMFHHFRTFFIVAVIGTFLTAIISRIFLSILGSTGLQFFSVAGLQITDRFLAHVIAVGTVFFYSYFAHKYISFDAGFRGLAQKFHDKYSRRAR